jgi:acetyl esterase/lipase
VAIEKARVAIQEDVTFGAGDGRDLKCDVYTPPDNDGNSPAILLIHGGAWKFGDRKQLRGYGFLLGREGYVCVATEYRLSEEAQWPEPMYDIKAALRWMRANHKDLGIDPTRIAVSGNSSGGHLGLLAAATANDPSFEGEGGNAGAGTDVAAAISFYGITELTAQSAMLKGLVREFLGNKTADTDYQAASPIHYARTSFPPTMLLQSSQDEMVPRQQSIKMYEALIDAGAPVELHMYDQVPHAFDQDPALAREGVRLILTFLNRYMPGPNDDA